MRAAEGAEQQVEAAEHAVAQDDHLVGGNVDHEVGVVLVVAGGVDHVHIDRTQIVVLSVSGLDIADEDAGALLLLLVVVLVVVVVIAGVVGRGRAVV